MMRHLLVVDDDPDVCSILQFGLEHTGEWRTSGATTVDQAWAVLNSDRPDAAIVDALLRGGSGLRLASYAVDVGVPVLIMTGDPATQQELDGLKCPYLAKPFHLDELRCRSRALLDDTAQHLRRMAELMQRLAKNRAALMEAIEASRECVARLQAEREARAEREALLSGTDRTASADETKA
jgi:DNA-binding response OmpR family regulator